MVAQGILTKAKRFDIYGGLLMHGNLGQSK